MGLIWKGKCSRVTGTPPMPSLSRAVNLLFLPLTWTGTGDPLGGKRKGLRKDWESRTRYSVVSVPMVEKCGERKSWKKRFRI